MTRPESHAFCRESPPITFSRRFSRLGKYRTTTVVVRSKGHKPNVSWLEFRDIDKYICILSKSLNYGTCCYINAELGYNLA